MFRGSISNPFRLLSVHVLPKQQRPLRSLLHGVLITPRPSLPLSQAEIQDSPLLVLQSPSFILPQNHFDRITPTVSQGSDPRAARGSRITVHTLPIPPFVRDAHDFGLAVLLERPALQQIRLRSIGQLCRNRRRQANQRSLDHRLDPSTVPHNVSLSPGHNALRFARPSSAFPRFPHQRSYHRPWRHNTYCNAL